MTKGLRVFLAIVGLAAAVLIGIWIKDRYSGPVKPAERPAPATTNEGKAPSQPASQRAHRPRTEAVPPIPWSAHITEADRAKAAGKFFEGLDLAGQGQWVAARASLADALNTNALTAEQADQARAKLTELADKTLFGREVLEGDPCTGWYTVQPGEVLVNIERKLRLRVPTQLIEKINRIADATKLQVGQKLKVIYGPFHAVVCKGRFTMDVYLEEQSGEQGRMIFVRRFRVGIGKDGSTPFGRWRVGLGGKVPRAPWTPPSSANLLRKTIRWGEPGYPFGKKGYWISLDGIKPNPYSTADGYGIHDTNEPTSIGRASSMGCIRLADEDMEWVFSMLYEYWSTVTVLP